MVNWSNQAVRAASGKGDYGRVIKLTRLDARVSQRQLGEGCGISQSAVSRLEGMGADGTYNMSLLARAAQHLGIPLQFVGLADQTATPTTHLGGSGVERRSFLQGAAAVAAVPGIASLGNPHAHTTDNAQASSLRLATSAFRRLDGTTPSRHLQEAVLAHLRLTQITAAEAHGGELKRRLAAVGSEVASLAGWLAWDMGDSGSSRTWYGGAIKAARRAGDRLLSAYQIGSLAQFEAHAGNAAQGLALIRKARLELQDHPLAIATAWLFAIEALAHAAAGDQQAADQSLTQAARAAEQAPAEEPAPWPWIFAFSGAKVAAMRLTCGALLGLPSWVTSSMRDAKETLSSGHEKQRALLMLDIASAQVAAGRVDGGFSLATQALETGIRYRSGRIVERARSVRRQYPSANPRVVRDFDDRLHDVYL
ncbi:helix-turn-helix domain-containing protein [Streptomyces odontomachi]|uniref:helix-turn-helix domain-containing protein n=1 Tax=Streptomyces odontomachi TaxID=2944940 RepID=UPI0021093E30|nr:helix-turn-helix transcriptional regulator [Streptomyces sp. ODS25]